MNRRTYGILVGMLGSALGAWWYARHRGNTATPVRDRGTVIFDNTPVASDDAIV